MCSMSKSCLLYRMALIMAVDALKIPHNSIILKRSPCEEIIPLSHSIL